MGKWLYLIADFSYGEEKIKAALEAGVDYIQLRPSLGKKIFPRQNISCGQKSCAKWPIITIRS